MDDILIDYFDWEKKCGKNAAPPVIKIYNVYVSDWIEYLNMSWSEAEALQLISAYEAQKLFCHYLRHVYIVFYRILSHKFALSDKKV